MFLNGETKILSIFKNKQDNFHSENNFKSGFYFVTSKYFEKFYMNNKTWLNITLHSTNFFLINLFF